MKLVCISDTHGQHSKLEIPLGDVLIHSGDATMVGKKDETKSFLQWFASQPHQYKIFVPGNHDFSFDSQAVFDKWNKNRYNQITNPDIDQIKYDSLKFCKDNGIIVLINESVVINEVNFYGTPNTPIFFNWAFNNSEYDLENNIYNHIPQSTEVLISHGPPKDILDLCTSGNVGSVALANRVKQLNNLKISIFGHIHDSHGLLAHNDGIIYINSSILDDRYKVKYDPISVIYKKV